MRLEIGAERFAQREVAAGRPAMAAAEVCLPSVRAAPQDLPSKPAMEPHRNRR